MHRLSSSFILGYHGCDKEVGDRLLSGERPKLSVNDYDWLGHGMYFWEANPLRGLEFAQESSRRNRTKIKAPAVIGAIIDLGLCLDLTTTGGVEWLRIAYESLAQVAIKADGSLPKNSGDRLRRNLDRAVIEHLHAICSQNNLSPIDTVKGIFTEGAAVYPGAGFY